MNAGPPNWIIRICRGRRSDRKDWLRLANGDSFELRTDLTDERGDPDDVVNGIGEQPHEHVSLAVDLPGIDLVEQRHHDERVEYHGEMLRWRCVEAGALAVVDVEDYMT